MRPLKILFTNNTLSARAGTELWVRDMALALRARGHTIAAYSPLLGSVADEIRSAGVEVFDDIDRLPWQPDVLHCHHHLEAMTAIVRFPSVPAVYVCHGAVPWEEEPPLHPNVRQWMCVDLPTRERLLSAGVPADRISLLHNFVDTMRFTPRAPLPDRPQRALVFSNQVDRSNGWRAIAKACREEMVAVTVAGLASGHVLEEPERVLGSLDLVFAKGRAALEAMAVGCAVVLCDANRVGPSVRFDDLGSLRELNFGMRTLNERLSARAVRERIRAYDPADAARVSNWIRKHATVGAAAERLERIYEACATEGVTADAVEQSRATARYISIVSTRVKYHEGIRRERDVLARRMKILAPLRRLIFWR